MSRIVIDEDGCIGCGACTSIAPDLFEMNEKGKAEPKKTKSLAQEEIAQAKEGADICPVQAIKLEE